MKGTKKVLLGIMVLCLILVGMLTPERTYAASDSDFVIENGVLTRYKGSGSDAVIPDGVKEIGYNAFSECSSLTSIVIPNGITKIGLSAFSGCNSLTSVTIPDGITEIGNSAFNGCSSLASITLPDSIVTIGSSAFSGCSSLTSVKIPDSVTKIENHAFLDCISLTSVVILDGVTEIGPRAFEGCSSLTNVEIPDSVTEIGITAFEGCSKLKEFTIPKSVSKLGSSILGSCDSLEKIMILNKKVNLIEAFPSGENKDALSTLIGDTFKYYGGFIYITKPTKTLTIYGYKYSTADEFAVRMNTLQITGKGFGIKSIKFIPLDKDKKTLDKIKVPKSITITKGKSKRLSIQLPPNLKRVNKFTKKQGQVKVSITYSKETSKEDSDAFYYGMNTKKVSNDIIKATEKGTGYAYTTVALPNGDKKVFATKVIIK